MENPYLLKTADKHGQVDPRTQLSEQSRIKWNTRIQPKTSAIVPSEFPTMATSSIPGDLKESTSTPKKAQESESDAEREERPTSSHLAEGMEGRNTTATWTIWIHLMLRDMVESGSLRFRGKNHPR